MKKNKEKKKNIFSFFAKMLFVFMIVFVGSNLFSSLIASSIFYNKYGSELIGEIMWCLLILIVMLLSGNAYVFTQKKEKFLKSIKLGIPIIAVGGLSLIISIISLDGLKTGNFINLLLYCISIGLTEEFLCRGWLQNEFIERYAKNRKQVVLSIILASLVFGVMHVTNLFAGQSLIETISQIVQATAAGIFLGSIYYRTKNIWSVVFLHAFYDFGIFLADVNLVKDCATTSSVTTEILIINLVSSLLLSIVYIFSSIIIMRKSKINKLIDENYELTENELKKEKKYKGFLYAGIALAFILTFVMPSDIEGYDEYYVCYDYEEKELKDYTVHYSYKEKYEMKSLDGKVNYNIYLNDETGLLEIKNSNTNDKVVLEEYTYVISFTVVENIDSYSIVVFDYTTAPVVYYTKVDKTTITSEKEFINALKDSFTKYDVPVLSNGGYLTVDDSEYRYPLLVSQTYDMFIIDEEDKLYLLK